MKRSSMVLKTQKESITSGRISRVLIAVSILIISLAFIIPGCTSSKNSTDSVISPTPTQTPTSSTGIVIVSHDVENDLPQNIDSIHYSFSDKNNILIFGPYVFTRSNSHVLENVPIDAKFMIIDYYTSSGATGAGARSNTQQGSTTIPVSVSDGDDTNVQVDGDPTGPVHFAQSGSQWLLMVDGTNTTVKGITGDYGGSDPDEFTYSYLTDNLPASGANAIRLYGGASVSEQVRDVKAALSLASAHSTDSNKIMVLVGFKFQGLADPVGDGKQAFDQIIADSNADHILGFCAGNEAVDAGNPDADMNKKINEFAVYIKGKSSLPVMTAIVNPTPHALDVYKQSMPDLDWIGVNSFYGKFDNTHQGGGFLNTLGPTMAKWGKPWIVSEYYSYDLPSPGSMPSQTINGYEYFLELNSTANAQNYKDCWNNYIVPYSQYDCVGGMALNWMPPHNSQVPGFWKDMFVYRGKFEMYVNWYQKYGVDRLECVDAVTENYGGTTPSNSCPQIETPSDSDPQGIDCDFKVTLSSAGKVVNPGDQLTASITASDPDSDNLTFDWFLMGGVIQTPTGGGITQGPSINTYKAWGVSEPPNAVITSSLIGNGDTTDLNGGKHKNTITFTLDSSTSQSNNYQLRVIIRDGNGGAATAAIGFPVAP
ncbi:MAG: hypothetical protein K8T10_12055 [Candidatus Eremiobacteraeota bacterium]|nr:hypothetical protein [Candidatus Eremiobacteraeota bacterium]